MRATKATNRRRADKKDAAKAGAIYLNDKNALAVINCAKVINKDASFIINALLDKIDLESFIRIKQQKQKLTLRNDENTEPGKYIALELTTENIKTVRNCALAIGKNESFVLNAVLDKIEFEPITNQE